MIENSKFLFVTLFSLLINTLCISQSKEYDIRNIPEELLLDAGAVVRVDSCMFKVKGMTKASAYYKYAVTIFKEKMKNSGVFSEYYNTTVELKNIKICLYNSKGDLIKAIKSTDIEDRSIYKSYEVNDQKIKYFLPELSEYPYTVEYEFTKSFESLFNMPEWNFQSRQNTSVQNSTLILQLADTIKFHYKLVNFNSTAQESISKEGMTYKWQVKDIKPYSRKPYDPANLHKELYLAPDYFKFEGHVGSMISWKSYGEWVYDLNAGRDKLDAETISKIQALVSNTSDWEEKIRIVYKYMQSKTRYVSVQLGIGGYQTFTAEHVSKYGIGDCKALSNYTMALLEAVGITAYCALVIGDDSGRDIDQDFVSQQFNHVILCVPGKADTIWLECTSQNYPAGYLGDFTGNKKALLITQKGGVLVNTHTYTKRENFVNRTIRVDINSANSKNKVNIHSIYSGQMIEDRFAIQGAKAEQQKKWLYENIELDNYTIKEFSFKVKESTMPSLEENLTLDMDNVTIPSKSGYFVYPLNYNNSFSIPTSDTVRLNPVVIKKDFILTDSTIYTISTTSTVQQWPKVLVSSLFGSYKIEIVRERDKLIWVRELTFNKGIYPKESYQELIKFLKSINKADRAKILVSLQ